MNHAETIINISAEHFGIPVAQLSAKTRIKEIVVCRQSAMKMLSEYTGLTLKSIGSYFDRDHTTVYHALITIEDYQYTDAVFSKKIDKLREKMKELIEIKNDISAEKSDVVYEEFLP